MSFARTTAAVALAALTLLVHDAGAQTLSKCGAGKKKCVSKKVAGLLKCHAKAEKKGLPVDTICLQKVRDKFDGGTNPAKGCFAKLEAKNQNCLTFSDTSPIENEIDAFVNQIVCDLDPFAGTCPTPTASPTCPSFVTPTPPPPTGTPVPTGTPPCTPTGPEICNGMDDDCNGLIDDGLGTTTCGVGACQNTVPACTGGSPTMCTPGMPSTEICNGMDDDCDGSADEGLGTISCGTGICMNTVQSCVMGMPQMCVPNSPGPEVCNGLDDNCNGQTDEGVISCGVGGCMNTVPKCVGGMNNTCTPGTPAPNEICGNAIDDDCDGTVDEMPCV